MKKGPTPNDFPWYEIPGLVQTRMAVWDPKRGWLTTRRGITHHGPEPTIESEILEESVHTEVEAGLRALKYRWKKP